MKSRVLAPLLAIALVSPAVAAEAGQRRGPSSGGRSAGRAAPRTSVGPRVVVPPSRGISPRLGGIAPYRSYYYPYYGYPYGPGLSFGYSLYGYPYGYGSYGYGAFYGSSYPYGPYGYPSAGYAYPGAGYVGVRPGSAYGGLRIEGAPSDAQVYADGFYVGIADDFDGSLQRLSLTPGPHQIEIRVQGSPSIMIDVRIEPGETITYHADRAR